MCTACLHGWLQVGGPELERAKEPEAECGERAFCAVSLDAGKPHHACLCVFARQCARVAVCMLAGVPVLQWQGMPDVAGTGYK